MTHPTDPDPADGDERPTEAESPSFDAGMAVTFGAFLVLAVGFAYGSTRIASEPWHAILVVMAFLAGLYAAYLMVIVALVVLVIRVLDSFAHGKPIRFWSHWPFWVWPPIAILGLSWPLIAELGGYDGSEWLWQGISAYVGVIAILAVFFRRDR